ncbi:MAG TPA: D-sedoheptulose 7-phosphate isomerase [Nitrosomonas europaea]|uniref:D-sedoheptulose 7-phosphate isomerase n=2 Tax=Nitrosomonas europaea TaxID=915 RepID=UPI0024900909|nr:D-sedoheptulose 7-phosphate isomerase [Nitrosomonas europaea]HRN82732.1 D-sedoheptulose 7-phosphate isomerase [Nitrosomonas europaea]HRO57204.1 D-sedoheptulose 7-phosphate isomerase [Nitrosomonas europaea]HUM74866.1 D-sedoheptulose 7-phosphate isomerase [Nitrosomonas europaea]
MRSYITSQIQETQRIMLAMLADEGLLSRVDAAAQACIDCMQAGNKILLAGNGGSAADAQHIAGEFVSRFAFDRPGLPAIALTTDTSILTAIGNDYGYENLFARQVQAHAQKGDVFIAYSTSGKSPNIITALQEAKSRGVICIGMSGNRGGPMKDLCDHYLDVPSADTPKIQEGHAVLGHILCGLVECTLFKAST